MKAKNHFGFWALPVLVVSILSAAPFNHLQSQQLLIGVSRVDITPDHPVRLTGYGNRTKVFDSVAQQLWAKALLIEEKGKSPTVWITMDIVGIPAFIGDSLFARLAKAKRFTNRGQIAITVTHTHNGPETGVLLNISGQTLIPEQLADVKMYRDGLLNKLEQLVNDAYRSKVAGKLSWAKGRAGFAMNRRVIENGKWKTFGETPSAPVDNDLPVLQATDAKGNILALLLSYACHGTTLVPEHNFIHGDWMGATQQLLEEKYPGVTAMVAIGCGADANPTPRGEFIHVSQHAKMIADTIAMLLSTHQFKPLTTGAAGNIKHVDLSFEHVPDARELVELSKMEAATGLYARNTLQNLAVGEVISPSYAYPIQVWTFGNQLAILFLGGEIVVDYSIRIKSEFDKNKIWVNGYSNDVSTYIASARLYDEGGYEVDGSMPYYNRPSRFTKDTEERIMKTIREIVPAGFGKK